jgi:hypothetical protein
MIYRQLPIIEKSQPIAPKYEIKPVAQHQTLRVRIGIYKIIRAVDLSYNFMQEGTCNLQTVIWSKLSSQNKKKEKYIL